MTPQPTRAFAQDIRYELLSGAPSPETIFRALYRNHTPAVWLDSSDLRAGLSRFSFIADTSHPSDYTVRYRSRERSLELRGNDGSEIRRQGIFDFLKSEMSPPRSDIAFLPFPFHGGFIGYLGYELKGETDGHYRHNSQLPDAYFLKVSRFLAFDHETTDCYIVASRDDEQWIRETLQTLEGVRPDAAPSRLVPTAPSEDSMPALRLEKDREAYVRAVQDALREIHLGQTYQVCLTARAYGDFNGDPFELYRTLRRRNPAPFSALLRDDAFSILSSSPERFLRIDTGGHVESRPIKGTIARSHISEVDAHRAQTLLRSEKDRAENVMITDLVRNDLGRVAKNGSVHVPSLSALETYETVHHLVSTVQAELKQGLSSVDCIQACFPGGSMTGAPKIQTMDILDRLESSARGVYSGALGYISYDGATDLSIVIRTLILADGTMSIGTGGGIVASSDPLAEFEEATLKAEAVIAAVREYYGQPGHV